jgi:Flp pilus assembly protein TadG
MHNRRANKKVALALDESGGVAVLVGIIFAVLCGCVGMAVDVGHMVMVKAELQRTADAGALAGAGGLAPYTGTGSNMKPNWEQGKAQAHIIISNPANLANNVQFTATEGTVLSGYWLLKPPINYVQTLPLTRPSVALLPEPAIKVTLTRTVNMIIAQVLPGVNKVQTVRAQATAILPALTSGVFTMAVEKSLVEKTGFDNQIQLYTDAVDFGWKDQGQWFTEQDATHQYPDDEGNNDVPTVRANGPVYQDDQIWIAPGAMDTLYHDIIVGSTVFLPVVESVEQKAWQKIIKFVSFTVQSLTPHSIHGNFVKEYDSPEDFPSAWGTPRLVSP